MKTLSEALTETRALLRRYAEGGHKGWAQDANTLLQALREPISTHDELRACISSFARGLAWGFQIALGMEGNSKLKSDLKNLLKTIPTSLEYENHIAQIEIEKQRKQISKLQFQLELDEEVKAKPLLFTAPVPDLSLALAIPQNNFTSSTLEETQSDCASRTLEMSHEDLTEKMSKTKIKDSY